TLFRCATCTSAWGPPRAVPIRTRPSAVRPILCARDPVLLRGARSPARRRAPVLRERGAESAVPAENVVQHDLGVADLDPTNARRHRVQQRLHLELGEMA